MLYNNVVKLSLSVMPTSNTGTARSLKTGVSVDMSVMDECTEMGLD